MEVDNIEKFLPQTGLTQKYMELTSGGQCCPRYRFFSFIATLGAVVNRKVYLQRGSKETFPTLYPNPWVLLIGPQGKGNKSSAMKPCRYLVENMPQESKPMLVSAKLSPEHLVKTLSSSTIGEKSISENILKLIRRDAICFIMSTELGILLGREKYLAGMAILLTELYDCYDSWSSGTIMRGDEKLYNICISLLGASTPDWMQTLLPKDAFEIGFMSRMVLVPLPKGWRVRKIPVEQNSDLTQELITDLTELTKIRGEMVLTLDAWDAYREWYLNLPEVPPGPQAEYLERKQDHVLRLATLLQLSIKGTLTLEGETFYLALSILNAIEDDVMELISYISMEPRMRIVKKILSKIEFEKEISEKDLLDSVWGLLAKPSEFDEVIQLLLRTKRVEVYSKGNRLFYKFRREGK